MKLKFKQQDFQTDAVNAVCALFDGQQRQTSTFSMEQSGGQMELFASMGVSNALYIDDGRIIENMRAVQRKNGLPQTDGLQGRAVFHRNGNWDGENLCLYKNYL